MHNHDFPDDCPVCDTVSENEKTAARPVQPAISRIRTALLSGSLLSGILLSSSGALADDLPDFEKLVAEQGDAVVSIAVEANSVPAGLNINPGTQGAPRGLPDGLPEQFRKFFERQAPHQQQPSRPARGLGSGFIISDDGYIMTNAHVVDNATSIIVSLQNHRELEATLVGFDESTDVALIKVKADQLPTVTIADFDDVKVGQWVLAIGSPFGLDQTASQGIVSALSRNLPSGTYVPFIQTDVAVNPGNSGGPLFNTDGEVIGVNSQIYSNTGGYQGLSFAIPIDIAMNIADQLKTTGHANRGWLGVAIQAMDADLAGSFGLEKPTGALIASVNANSPAEKAGLQAGDVILRFNDKSVESSSALPALVAAVPIGDTVPITIQRDDKRRNIEVTVGDFAANSVAMAGASSAPDRLTGLAVAALSEAERDKSGIDKGIRIRQVAEASPAADAGLQPGDILLSLDGKPVTSVEDFEALSGKLPTGQPIPVLVQREGNAMFRTLQLPTTVE